MCFFQAYFISSLESEVVGAMFPITYKKSVSFLPSIAAILLLSGCSILPKSPISLESKTNDASSLYRGVFHVHTKYSHDSGGSLDEVLKAAHGQDLDFVVITDHNSLAGKLDPVLQHPTAQPLLIIGNEISTTEGHLIALGTREEIKTPIEPQAAIDLIHEQGGFAVLAHPICDRTNWKNWDVKNYDGIEVYNFACDFYASNKPVFFLKSLLLPPGMFVKQTVKEPRRALNQWDFLLSAKPVLAFGAADAHVHRIFGFPFMRYSLAFRPITMYVEAASRSEGDILDALKSGKSFVVFESLGRVAQFSFLAQSAGKNFKSGSVIRSESPVALTATAPASSEIRLIHQGKIVRKARGGTLVFDAVKSGSYRVEVFRRGKIWIISNPITLGT